MKCVVRHDLRTVALGCLARYEATLPGRAYEYGEICAHTDFSALNFFKHLFLNMNSLQEIVFAKQQDGPRSEFPYNMYFSTFLQ